MSDVGARVERARAAAGLSQRGLAEATGISQASLSRLIAGTRTPKAPELVSIADATGTTYAALAGTGPSARARCVARSTNGNRMDGMREVLAGYLDLDGYLDDQGIARCR